MEKFANNQINNESVVICTIAKGTITKSAFLGSLSNVEATHIKIS